MIELNKHNVIVYGIGHSGTSIIAQSLLMLGWRSFRLDPRFHEEIPIRQINNRILAKEKVPQADLDKVLSKLPKPFMIKDPRLVFTLEYWIAALKQCDKNLVMIWVIRDLGAVEDSYRRRGELRNGLVQNMTIKQIFQKAKTDYDKWYGPKLIIDHDKIRKIAKIWK